jgi:hypothetical protein
VITPTNAVFYLGNTNGLSWMNNNDANATVNFTTGTTIGGDGNNDGSGFVGSLSEVAVFNSSLSLAQITQLFVDGSATTLPPPSAPTGLSAAAGNSQVTISWNASVGAAGYNVKRSTTSNGETTINQVTGTIYTDSQLANGKTYYYEVSAINSGGESANSPDVSATPSGSITNYFAGVLALHPVGFWPLNETSGITAFDASGNGCNGTYQSNVKLGLAGVANPPHLGFPNNGVAAGFSGLAYTNSCVTLSNLPITSINVTITEWIYPTDPGAIGTTFWNAGQNAGFAEAYYDNAALGYNWHGGDGNQWTYTAFTPPVDQWSFVALVITPTNAVFFLGNTNGLLSLTNPDANSAVNFTTGTTIGGPGFGNTGLNGSLSDVAIFNYSLSPAAINQLYAAAFAAPVPPLVLKIAPPSNGQFTLEFSGTSGQSYVVEMSTNLEAGNWMPVYSNFQGGGVFTYTDTNMVVATRFYRVMQ